MKKKKLKHYCKTVRRDQLNRKSKQKVEKKH